MDSFNLKGALGFFLRYFSVAWNMRHSSHSSVQGACCFDIGFRHMFSAFDCVSFGWCICRAVKSPLRTYTDASPGVGSLVGGELSQSLGARLLVSVLRRMGSLEILITLFYS